MTLHTIVAIERCNSSVNGNPAWHITFADGSGARTQSDASIGYAIGNVDLREGRRVGVEFSRAGRITHMVPA